MLVLVLIRVSTKGSRYPPGVEIANSVVLVFHHSCLPPFLVLIHFTPSLPSILQKEEQLQNVLVGPFYDALPLLVQHLQKLHHLARFSKATSTHILSLSSIDLIQACISLLSTPSGTLPTSPSLLSPSQPRSFAIEKCTRKLRCLRSGLSQKWSTSES